MPVFSARRIARRAALIAALSVGSGVSALGADANDLINQLKALTTVVEPTAEGKAALAALALAIQKSNCDASLDASDKTKCLLEAVKGAFNASWKAAGDKKAADQAKSINALVDIAATGQEKNAKHDPEKSAQYLADLLIVALDELNEKRKKEPPEDPPKKGPMDETIEKLVKALTVLPKAKEKPTPAVINVASAFYGDFDFIEDLVKKYPAGVTNTLAVDSKRVCNALRAIRSECQGEQDCLRSPPTGRAITGLLMCGYEPAPYAQPWNKGLVVNYQCVDFEWDAFGTKPPYNAAWKKDLPETDLRVKELERSEKALKDADQEMSAARVAFDEAMAKVESRQLDAAEKRQKANSDAQALKRSDPKNRAALQRQADESAAEVKTAKDALEEARADVPPKRTTAASKSKTLEEAKESLRKAQVDTNTVPESRWAVLRNGQLSHLTCTQQKEKEKEEAKTTGSAGGK